MESKRIFKVSVFDKDAYYRKITDIAKDHPVSVRAVRDALTNGLYWKEGIRIEKVILK